MSDNFNGVENYLSTWVEMFNKKDKENYNNLLKVARRDVVLSFIKSICTKTLSINGIKGSLTEELINEIISSIDTMYSTETREQEQKEAKKEHIIDGVNVLECPTCNADTLVCSGQLDKCQPRYFRCSFYVEQLEKKLKEATNGTSN